MKKIIDCTLHSNLGDSTHYGLPWNRIKENCYLHLEACHGGTDG